MNIKQEDLDSLLVRFSGRKINLSKESAFKVFSLGFFTSNTIPTFHADVPFEATDIYSNYKLYHKRSNSSFNAYLFYHLIQTMQKKEFAFLRYRYINGDWYCFDNPPFFISVSVTNPAIQQVSFFIENVGQLSWGDFVTTYTKGVAANRKSDTGVLGDNSGWYGIPYLITNMPFNFTAYTPSQKQEDYNAHAPWFVVSPRQGEDEQMRFMLSCTLSHASGLPVELNAFLKALKESLLKVPKTQQITSYFNVPQ